MAGSNPRAQQPASDPSRASPARQDGREPAAGELTPLAIGPLQLWPPVVLAPMAGVTDAPFRALCRGFARAGLAPFAATATTAKPGAHPGLFVSEMVTARPLVEGDRKTARLASFGPGEHPRSLQLYGVDPRVIGEAVARLVGEGRVDHIDLNFGCPVPKITRRGGGAAIPAKPRLLARIVAAAVRAAGSVPVTIKFRKGIDDQLITFRAAGRVAQEEGCAAVGLHARTAIEFYQDGADWQAIAELVDLVDIPVLGNGDIWEAHDALRMLRQTGCAGVIVGRGCLGRPWLFRELAELAGGRRPTAPPRFGTVAQVMREHAEAMVAWVRRGQRGEASHAGSLDPERAALRAFRKHASWYTKGFRGSATLREQLMRVETLDELARTLASCDADEPFPEQALRAVRGKRGRQTKVALPAGFRAQLDDDRPPGREAGQASSGG